MKSLASGFATFTVALISAALFACAQLDIPTADTFNERLAVAYSSVTGIRRATVSLLDAKKIGADDGQNVLTQTDNLRAGLDIARGLARSNSQAANDKLAAVRAALTGLQSYIAAREKITSP